MRLGWYLGILGGSLCIPGAAIHLIVTGAWGWGAAALGIWAVLVAYTLLYRPWRHADRPIGPALLPPAVLILGGLALLAAGPLATRFSWGSVASAAFILVAVVAMTWRRRVAPPRPARRRAPG